MMSEENVNEALSGFDSVTAIQERFLADASHELRTPLAILRGEIEVTLRREREGAEYRATLESCLEEIQRLSRLVDNLLLLARNDAAPAGAGREWTDVSTVCRQVCEQLAPFAEARNQTLEVQATETLMIRIDPHALNRALFNLVENAILYTPEGGRIAAVAVASSDAVLITIADTGSGIPAEQLPNIFDRFYRVDTARSRKDGGVGLGLPIVKALVEASGGRIEVESRVGEGSRFTVRLPPPCEGDSEEE